MSPRPKRLRKIINPPTVKGFKPYGMQKQPDHEEPVFLLYEEYEAMRLCDFEMLNHQEASEIMNVSRPTFTRIYASARAKIANAFVKARQIVIEGGKIYFDSEWHLCTKCSCYFNNPDKTKTIENCPLCGSTHIQIVEEDFSENGENGSKCKDVCTCPKCGYEQEHPYGVPCREIRCHRCNNLMVFKINQTIHKR
jgi:uncharacterized protein